MARCPDCWKSSDIFGLYGDGVCSHCYGDGKSLISGLNEAIMGHPIDCEYCHSSGQCQTCGGSGEVPGERDSETKNYPKEESAPHMISEESPENDGYSSDSNNCGGSVDSDFSKEASYETPPKISSLTSQSGQKIFHKVDHRTLSVKKDHRKIHNF